MPHSFGYRARTRDKFSRGFRKHGVIALGTYMTPFKVGDYVDVIANSAVQKGMPHRFYHGRTGVVFNVSKAALGVEINKVVRNRQLKKRINVRVEHVRPSKCRQDFLNRVKKNELLKRQAKESGVSCDPALLRRSPGLPRAGYEVAPVSSTGATPEKIMATPFDEML